MPALSLSYHTVQATARHTATVIFVHGLGDSGYGWEPVARMLGPRLPHVKWVLPHAPPSPVTANFGMTMPSWFDIREFPDEKGTQKLPAAQEDEKGMLESANNLNEIITNEVNNGLDSRRIVLGGFSQGGVLSLLTGLTKEQKLGGLVVLSGWLPLRDKFQAMLSGHAKSVPIFWGHGDADPLVPLTLAKASVDYLTNRLGLHVQEEIGGPGLKFLTYAGLAHSASEKEMGDLAEFLERVVPQSAAT